MPQNTPMKRQFTTIDGRTVMSNLPQHWKGDDWAITGVDNPLPVGNYIQTDSGVWIPQKGSDDGAADVRLTGSYVEEVSIRKREQLLPRAVRTSSASLTITVPIGAKKAVILGRFNRVTGTNVEYYLSAFLRGTAFTGNAYGPRLTTEKQSISYAEHFIYIGSNGTGDATPSLGKVVTTPLPLTHAIKFDLIINGEFEEGQGVDCSVEIFWIS